MKTDLGGPRVGDYEGRGGQQLVPEKTSGKNLAYKCWYAKVAGVDSLDLFLKYLFLPPSLDNSLAVVIIAII